MPEYKGAYNHDGSRIATIKFVPPTGLVWIAVFGSEQQKHDEEVGYIRMGFTETLVWNVLPAMALLGCCWITFLGR